MPDLVVAASFRDFVELSPPLCLSPLVTVRVGSSGPEYNLSQALLCRHSQFFKAAFEGKFREGEEQAVTLDEEDGVVSVRSFELLVQWMYIGRVVFGDLSETELITAAIEFARIADLCDVTGMEAQVAEHIKVVVLASTTPPFCEFDANTYLIYPDHDTSAARLPKGHPIRKIMADASVKGYLMEDKHKFATEIKENAGFSSDLLEATKGALKTLKKHPISGGILFRDPFSGQEFFLV